MADRRFEADPFSNTGNVFTTDGFTGEGTVRDFTGGALDVRGTALVDVATGRILTNLGQQGPYAIIDAGNGRYDVRSQTLTGIVNQPLPTTMQRLASGTVDVYSPVSGMTSLQFTDATISRIGYQWIAYPREDGTVGLTRSSTIYETNADLKTALGEQFRIATPEEAILYAAAFDIISKNESTVLDLLRESGVGTDEELSTYDLAQRLLLQYGSMRDVAVYTRTLIGGPGD